MLLRWLATLSPTWASWQQWWPTIGIHNFISAYQNVYKRRDEAQTKGLAITTYVPEATRAPNAPGHVLSTLFQKLSLRFTPAVNWTGNPICGSTGSKMIMPLEPYLFITPKVHKGVEQAESYHFSDRTMGIDSTDIPEILDARLLDIYDMFRRSCEVDMGVYIEDVMSHLPVHSYPGI